jgi:hypothetical protein
MPLDANALDATTEKIVASRIPSVRGEELALAERVERRLALGARRQGKPPRLPTPRLRRTAGAAMEKQL